MNTVQTFNEAVELVFSTLIRCEISDVCHSLLKSDTEEEEITIYEERIKETQIGTYEHVTGVVYYEECISDCVNEMVFGLGREGLAEYHGQKIGVPISNVRYLSIADIATIFGKDGSLTIVELNDLTKIKNILTAYFIKYEELKYSDIIYTEPPEEDLLFLAKLKGRLEYVTKGLIGQDENPLARLKRMLSMGVTKRQNMPDSFLLSPDAPALTYLDFRDES
jgi:hypothetical protein